ncbi:MAG: pilus assembly protein [Rhodobacteraceae bacterium]|nr:pilus assembly protein [Paracoccaceae bacterium]
MTGGRTSPVPSLRRFAREEEGAALVEFAMVLPMLLLIFAMIVESARVMIGFQSAIAGVRDATRYLARIAPMNICATGTAISTYDAQVGAIANQNLGTFFLPQNVTVTSVSSSLDCTKTGTYRISPPPIATVTAVVTIAMPFSGLFAFGGGNTTPTFSTTISDSARVYGS